jgi:GH25 family lysozyme M1 (1,4-beta-N-acetylmuramidase)
MIAVSPVAAPPLPKLPYRGIEPFRYIDRQIFFGREEDVDDLFHYIRQYRGALLYGDSGSGKSSLINAGLISKAIAAGYIPERLRVQPKDGEELVITRTRASETSPDDFLPSSLPEIAPSQERMVLSIDSFRRQLGLFHSGILHDPLTLMRKLREQADPLSKHIRSQFSEDGRKLLEAPDSRCSEESARRILVKELICLLQNGLLYEPERFAHITIRQSTLTELQQLPQDGDLVRLNRLLLADAYPDCIKEPAERHRFLEGRRPLLIFDQFEEYITLFAEADLKKEQVESARTAQQAILYTLTELLRDQSVAVKLLFVFREDYLAKFSGFFALAPTLPDQALRITPLRTSALNDIVRGPFKRFPDSFERELPSNIQAELVTQLSARSEDGVLNLAEVQIACLGLYEAKDRDATFKKGVQGLLEDFLSVQIAHLAEVLRPPAVALLNRMVTTSGTRNIVSEDDLLDPAQYTDRLSQNRLRLALTALEAQAKLVRRELRRQSAVYEILSEYLVPSIREQKLNLERLNADRERRQKIMVAALSAIILVCTMLVGFYLGLKLQADAQTAEDNLGKTTKILGQTQQALNSQTSIATLSASLVTSQSPLGIDVSHHNGAIDWKSVRASGITFCYCKAAEGKTFKDPMFDQNWVGMKRAEIVRGAYLILKDTSHPIYQADNFCRSLHLDSGDLPPALDIGFCEATDPAVLSKLALATLQEMHKLTHRRPIVFVPVRMRDNPALAQLREYPLWIGHHTNASSPKVPVSWRKWTFWQYSDGHDGRILIPGASRPTDFDRFNGSRTGLANFIRDSMD